MAVSLPTGAPASAGALSLNPGDALRFMAAQASRDGRTSPVQLVALQPDGGTLESLKLHPGRPDALDPVSAFVRKHRGAGVYLHSGTLVSGFAGRKAAVVNVAGVTSLWVDVDPRAEETVEACKARVHAMIEALAPLGLAPDAVVHSGNGCQLYWWTARFTFGPGTTADTWSSPLRRLAAAFGADPAPTHAAALMRLPGTINNPNATKRAKGRTACTAALVSLRPYDAVVRPLATIEQVEAFVLAVEAWAAEHLGTTPAPRRVPFGASSTIDLSASAPLYPADLILSALGAIPNDEEHLPTRDGFVEVLAAFKAGLGREAEAHRGEAEAWATTHGWADRDYFEKVWCSLSDVRVGPDRLFQRAKALGWKGGARADFAGQPVKETEGAIATAQAQFDRIIGDRVGRALHEMNERYAAARIGGDLVMLRFGRPGGLPDIMKKTAFFDLEAPNKITTAAGKPLPLARLWFEWAGRRTYAGGYGMWPLARDGRGPPPPEGAFNTWRGFSTTPAPDDGSGWPTVREYLLDVLCAGDAAALGFLIDWFAQAVQRPFVKPGTAIILKGRQGTGKTTFATLLRAIFDGLHVVSVDRADALTGRFNGHLADALFVVADEAAFAGDPTAQNRLKAFVTDPFISVERKHVDQVSLPSFHRLVMTSNEDHVVRAETDARRWMVLEVSDVHANDARFFGPLNDVLTPGSAEMRGFLRDLLARDVADAAVRRAPTTAGLVSQIVQSLPAPQRWMFERLRDCLPAATAATAKAPADGFGCADFGREPRWPAFTLKAALRDDYRRWADGQRHLRGGGDTAFGRLLQEMGRESQPRVNGVTMRVVELGDLAAARATFARVYLRGTDDASVWGEDAGLSGVAE